MTDLQSILSVIQILIIPVVGYGVRVLKDIRDEFRALNGRMTRIEQWRDDHIDADDTTQQHFRDLLNTMPCKQDPR